MGDIVGISACEEGVDGKRSTTPSAKPQGSLVVVRLEVQPGNVEQIHIDDDGGVGRDPGASGRAGEALGEGEVARDVEPALSSHLQLQLGFREGSIESQPGI